MELTFDNVKTIMKLVQDMDIWTLPLLMSMLIPIFFVLIAKLFGLEQSIETSPHNEAVKRGFLAVDPGVALTSITAILALFDKVGSAFSLGEVKGKKIIFGLSLSLFIIGVMLILYRNNQIEKVKLAGLAIEKYMKHNHAVSVSLTIAQKYGIDKDILQKYFPKEFLVINPDSSGSACSLILMDSMPRLEIINWNVKLLDSHLDRCLILGQCVAIDDLDTKVNRSYFIHDFVYELIARKPEKYSLGLNLAGFPSIKLIKKEWSTNVTKDSCGCPL